jgi:DNA-binding protein YbaB
LELKDLKDIVKDIAIGVHAGSAELKDLKDVIVSVHPEDAKAEVLSGVVVKVDPDVEDIHIGDIHVSDTIKGKHTVIDIGVDNKVFAVVDKGEKEFQIFIKADFDKDTRAQYEKAVKEIKEKLPETYKVESEIDEDKGTVTIKITGGADKKDTKISLDKLMKDIKEVIAHIKGVLTIDIE